MSAAAVPCAGSHLLQARHVCAFFHSLDEEFRVLLPFIQDGFASGDRAFHVVDPKLREEHLRRLREAGIDVAQSEPTGQLKLCDWNAAHLQNGHFDQHKMIAFLEEMLKEGARQGFPLSRSIGHMEWALEDRPGVEDLVEYEARLNYVLPRYPDPIICVYDLNKFGGAVVLDILRTHPMVIIGGTLQENPFFVSPDQFLKELHERQADWGSS
jgi:hypothetical protein